MNRFIIMKENDMVATALVDLKANDFADVLTPNNEIFGKYQALEYIPYGNKIALTHIKQGDPIIKYGAVIGEATTDICKGALVHVHNVKSLIVDIPPAFKEEIMKQMHILNTEVSNEF